MCCETRRKLKPLSRTFIFQAVVVETSPISLIMATAGIVYGSYASKVPDSDPYISNVRMGKSKRRLLIAVGGILAAGLVAVGIRHYYNTMDVAWSIMAPPQEIELATKMAELRRSDNFDEAVNLGLHSITGHAEDDFIYQMIATTYFIRALHDKDQSGKWTRVGAGYSEKALAANPKDIANVFNVGMNYMIAGDDLDTGGCEYYRKAEIIFENLTPQLQANSAEIQGRTVRLAAFRKQNQEQLVRVRRDLRQCQQQAK